MTKRYVLVVAVLCVVIVAGFFYWRLHRASNIGSFDECVAAGYPATQSYPEQCTANGAVFVEPTDITQEAVGSVVTNFAQKLQFVSILAPTSSASLAIADNYSGLVASGLLARWESAPSKAPGRTVSSPWPDHIVVNSVTAVNSSTYNVQGNVVEITSEELANGGTFDQYPVSATVQQIGGNWMITGWERIAGGS